MATAQPPDTHPTSSTTEDYLQALYNLSGDDHSPVAGIRLAERLKLAHPTVIGTVRRMVRDGLVESDDHRKIVLTAIGRAKAEDVVRRHCLAERFCTDILGMAWYKAHEEAHHIEHALSPEVEARLAVVLGNPERCPHGNPIPGSSYQKPQGLRTLSSVDSGVRVLVDSIDESVEDEPRLLEFLDEHGIVPAAELDVVGNADYLGTVSVTAQGREATISRDLADKVRVLALA
jgi:DtxR family Mn-dependent transcriptional regulator